MELGLAQSQTTAYPVATPTPLKSKHERIGIIGLGYVGLPVAVALAEEFEVVVGFDSNSARVEALQMASDWTNEVESETLLHTSLKITDDPLELSRCSIYIVAVPTPVDDSNRPDFTPLKTTCRVLAPNLRRGDVVVFESTVYPGATEEICGPELQKHSGLVSGTDFHLAYSPERISPGDQDHQLDKVIKIVAADSPRVLDRVAQIYEDIIPAGVHRAPSIRVAEAAKVFENTQRDVNIALMNEFALICDKLDIRTRDVISATATKWNSLPFSPGLVGGHCIGVDPFYLTSKAETIGAYPEIMLASRRRNEAMADEIATRAIKFLAERGIAPGNARIGIFGLTFKENVPDLRNSKVLDIVDALKSFNASPLLTDPFANPNELRSQGYDLSPKSSLKDLDLLLLAVPHANYLGGEGSQLQENVRKGGVVMDIRSFLEPSILRPDITYWGL